MIKNSVTQEAENLLLLHCQNSFFFL